MAIKPATTFGCMNGEENKKADRHRPATLLLVMREQLQSFVNSYQSLIYRSFSWCEKSGKFWLWNIHCYLWWTLSWQLSDLHHQCLIDNHEGPISLRKIKSHGPRMLATFGLCWSAVKTTWRWHFIVESSQVGSSISKHWKLHLKMYK